MDMNEHLHQQMSQLASPVRPSRTSLDWPCPSCWKLVSRVVGEDKRIRIILRADLHSGGISPANARGETSWEPETLHPLAYANSSFFKSRTAGSSPAAASEELLVLERMATSVESWHCTVTEPLPLGLSAPGPRIPWKDSLPQASVVPLLKRKEPPKRILLRHHCVFHTKEP